MLYYQVNNKQIYNPYLAYYESYQSGKPVDFYCYDDEYTRLDWTQEPEESFEQLMDHYAIELSNRYEKIILPWSGGTDSQTIYNVFCRNNLHIDEIIVCMDGDSCTQVHADWILKTHTDATTKITIFRGPTTDFRKIIHHDDVAGDGTVNDDWVFQNKSDLFKFGPVGSAPFFDTYAMQHYSQYRYVVVTGYEKPSVYNIGDVWYTRQSDIVLSSVLGRPNLNCFFLEPRINLKQSHMAKKFLKQIKKIDSNEAKKIQKVKGNSEKANNAKLEYKVQSSMSGRHSELVFGSSFTQKENNFLGYKSIIINPTDKFTEFDQGETFLKHAIASQDQLAIGFIRGLHNIVSDTNFMNFLNQQVLETPNKLFSIRPIWSKSYNLGT
jgi:hypothetical protein